MLLSLVSTQSSCIPHSNLWHHISTTLKWWKCFCHQIRGPKGRGKSGRRGDKRRSSWAEYLLGDQSTGLIWVKRLLSETRQSFGVRRIWQHGSLQSCDVNVMWDYKKLGISGQHHQHLIMNSASINSRATRSTEWLIFMFEIWIYSNP